MDKILVRRLIIAQLSLTLLAAALLSPTGWANALSGLAGGLIATLANALFAWRVFVQYSAREPERLLGRFYGAEIQKLAFVGLLFAGAVIGIDTLSVGALLGVFLLVQIVPPMIVTRI